MLLHELFENADNQEQTSDLPNENNLGRPLTGSPQALQNFWNWFKDSKIVDRDGRPIVMYTGTSKDQDFTSFNISKRGAWFTNDRETASSYASDNESMNLKYDSFTGRFHRVHTRSRVIPAYIKMVNPKIYLSDKDFNDVITKLGGTGENGYKKGQRLLFDQLRMSGHDGAVIGSFDGYFTAVVLRNANQIKSTTGNVGSYSSSGSYVKESHMRIHELLEGGFRYDPEIIKAVIKAWDSGIRSYNQIAQVTGLSLSQVQDILKTYHKDREGKQQDYTQSQIKSVKDAWNNGIRSHNEIAQVTGLTLSQVHRILKRYHKDRVGKRISRPFDEKEKADIIKQYRQGIGTTTLGKEFNREIPNIHRMLQPYIEKDPTIRQDHLANRELRRKPKQVTRNRSAMPYAAEPDSPKKAGSPTGGAINIGRTRG